MGSFHDAINQRLPKQEPAATGNFHEAIQRQLDPTPETIPSYMGGSLPTTAEGAVGIPLDSPEMGTNIRPSSGPTNDVDLAAKFAAEGVLSIGGAAKDFLSEIFIKKRSVLFDVADVGVELAQGLAQVQGSMYAGYAGASTFIAELINSDDHDTDKALAKAVEVVQNPLYNPTNYILALGQGATTSYSETLDNTTRLLKDPALMNKAHFDTKTGQRVFDSINTVMEAAFTTIPASIAETVPEDMPNLRGAIYASASAAMFVLPAKLGKAKLTEYRLKHFDAAKAFEESVREFTQRQYGRGRDLTLKEAKDIREKIVKETQDIFKDDKSGELIKLSEEEMLMKGMAEKLRQITGQEKVASSKIENAKSLEEITSLNKELDVLDGQKASLRTEFLDKLAGVKDRPGYKEILDKTKGTDEIYKNDLRMIEETYRDAKDASPGDKLQTKMQKEKATADAESKLIMRESGIEDAFMKMERPNPPDPVMKGVLDDIKDTGTDTIRPIDKTSVELKSKTYDSSVKVARTADGTYTIDKLSEGKALGEKISGIAAGMLQTEVGKAIFDAGTDAVLKKPWKYSPKEVVDSLTPLELLAKDELIGSLPSRQARLVNFVADSVIKRGGKGSPTEPTISYKSMKRMLETFKITLIERNLGNRVLGSYEANYGAGNRQTSLSSEIQTRSNKIEISTKLSKAQKLYEQNMRERIKTATSKLDKNKLKAELKAQKADYQGFKYYSTMVHEIAHAMFSKDNAKAAIKDFRKGKFGDQWKYVEEQVSGKGTWDNKGTTDKQYYRREREQFSRLAEAYFIDNKGLKASAPDLYKLFQDKVRTEIDSAITNLAVNEKLSSNATAAMKQARLLEVSHKANVWDALLRGEKVPEKAIKPYPDLWDAYQRGGNYDAVTAYSDPFGIGMAWRGTAKLLEARKLIRPAIRSAIDTMWKVTPLGEKARQVVIDRFTAFEVHRLGTESFLKKVQGLATPKELAELAYYVEGTANPKIAGDTFTNLSGRISAPVKEFLASEWRSRSDKIFGQLVDAGLFKEESYIKDFVHHAYKNASKGGAGMVRFLKTAPKGRFIESAFTAYKDHGLELKGDFIDLIRTYENTVMDAMTNRLMLDGMKKLKVRETILDKNGNSLIREIPVILTSKLAQKFGITDRAGKIDDFTPNFGRVGNDRWALLNHHALRAMRARRAGDGTLLLSDAPVYVHPDVAYALRSVFEKRFDNPLVRTWEYIGSVAKSAELTMSAFHHLALWESAVMVAGGTKETIKAIIDIPYAMATGKGNFQRGLKLLDDPAYQRRLARYGVEVGNAGRFDIATNLSSSVLEMLGEGDWQKITVLKPLGTVVGKPIRGLKAAKEWNERLLWDTMHRGYKSYYFEKTFQSALQDKAFKGMKPDEIGQIVGSFINDAFGGQNWNRNFFMSPRHLQMARMILLAPDWTWSQIKMGTGGALEIAKPLIGMKANPLKRRLYTRYLVRGVLATYLFHEGLNRLLTRDDENPFGRSMLDNDPGHRTEITLPWKGSFSAMIGVGKLAEPYKNVPGIGMVAKYLSETDERKRYVHISKQIREQSGWATHPFDTFAGKANPLLREVFAQATSHEAGSGWPTDFAEKTGWQGSLRAKHAVQMFVPFSLGEGQFAMAAPMRKGTSFYKAVKDIVGIYADNKGYLDPRSLSQSKFKNVIDILKAARSNGNDPNKVFNRARGLLNTVLYQDFFTAWQDADFDTMNELAKTMGKRGFITKAGMKASMGNKAEGKFEVQDILDQFEMRGGTFKDKYDLMRFKID